MELCSLCEKIKEIREQQSKDYYRDLCFKCKTKIHSLKGKEEGKVIRLVF